MSTCPYCLNTYASSGGLTRHLSFCPEKRSKEAQANINNVLRASTETEKRTLAAVETVMKGAIADAMGSAMKRMRGSEPAAINITIPAITINVDARVVNNVDARVVNNVDARALAITTGQEIARHENLIEGFTSRFLLEVRRCPEAWKTAKSTTARLREISAAARASEHESDRLLADAIAAKSLRLADIPENANENQIREYVSTRVAEIDAQLLSAIREHVPAEVQKEFDEVVPPSIADILAESPVLAIAN
jgi:hypothetical protein